MSSRAVCPQAYNEKDFHRLPAIVSSFSGTIKLKTNRILLRNMSLIIPAPYLLALNWGIKSVKFQLFIDAYIKTKRGVLQGTNFYCDSQFQEMELSL